MTLRSSLGVALLAAACLQLACGRALLAPAPAPSGNSFTYSGPFQNLTLQPLPYGYGDLEPYIDAATMKLHHDTHNQAYVTNVNVALAKAPSSARDLTLLGLNHNVGVNMLGDEATATAIRNNAGGAWNHAFFFKCMAKPTAANASTNAPAADSPLSKAIDSTFGSFSTFKTNFSEAATKRFGSGFAWLVVNNSNKLAVFSTPNQDNPLMQIAPERGIPILTLDVWEHAYYLKYNASRPSYIKNWWNVVNWPYVEDNYKMAVQGMVPVVASA